MTHNVIQFTCIEQAKGMLQLWLLSHASATIMHHAAVHRTANASRSFCIAGLLHHTAIASHSYCTTVILHHTAAVLLHHT